MHSSRAVFRVQRDCQSLSAPQVARGRFAQVFSVAVAAICAGFRNHPSKVRFFKKKNINVGELRL